MLWVFADLVRVAFFFECTPAFLRAVLQGRAWAWCFLGTGHVACGMLAMCISCGYGLDRRQDNFIE